MFIPKTALFNNLSLVLTEQTKQVEKLEDVLTDWNPDDYEPKPIYGWISEDDYDIVGYEV